MRARIASALTDITASVALGLGLFAAPAMAGYLAGAFDAPPPRPAIVEKPAEKATETDERPRRITEDHPLWDCRIDGNRICGPEFMDTGEIVRAVVDNSENAAISSPSK